MAGKVSNWNFNDFFAMIYLVFFLTWLVMLIVMLVNFDIDTLVALGLGTVTGVLLGPIILIVQYYYRKSPPKTGGS